MDHRNCSSRLGLLGAVLAVGLGSGVARANGPTNLVAVPFDKSITLANGATTTVPMWGYAEADPNDPGGCTPLPGTASSPGPRITVPPGGSLTINLCNLLPVPTSIVIPGLPSPGTPSYLGARATSFTAEVAAGGSGTYTWSSVRPGTYLYQSGSHVQVQVQMGLYGAVVKDAAAGQAYDGKAYASEVVLFYSEIDPALHQAVATGGYGGLLPVPMPGGAYGTPLMTSTFNYKPRYFLVNGDAYSPGRAPETAGAPGAATLIRFLNAGLRTHVPVLQNGDFELVAEDAHPYPYSRRQYQLSLFAGKTMDVLWTPEFAGTWAIFDRAPHLTTDGAGPGGMIAKLAVAGTLATNDDVYGARNDRDLVVAAPGVMGNDSAITTATLVTGPADGTLIFNADGSFTYTAPAGFTGPAAFEYEQGGDTALVTINVSDNAAPVAAAGSATTAEDTAAAITLQAIDANSDAITYAIGIPPQHGVLSGIPPNVIYTPAPNYNGPDSFTFTASDDLLTSAPASIDITVSPVNDPPAANSATAGTPEDTAVVITLAGSDIDADALAFTITSPPANGTLSAIAVLTATTAQVTYTPRLNYSGTDTFRFLTTDPDGATSPVATITVPVTPVPDNPIAVNDTYSTRYNVATTLDVLANDRDPDGSPITINNPAGTFPKCFNSTTGAFLSQGAGCASTTGVDKVTITSTATRLTMVPNSSVRRNRSISFTYQARDSGGALSTAATVVVNVSR